MINNPLIVLLGATASGKTKLAVSLAAKLDAEIISADSRQIFRNMDIGTGKDLNEYVHEGKLIPYHLIDILNPGERYHVDAFKNDFYKAYDGIIANHKTPILCGGTGLYIQSVLQNLPYTSVPIHLELRASLETLSIEQLIETLQSYPQNDVKHADLNSKKRLIRAIEIAEYLRHNELKPSSRQPINSLVFGLRNEVQVTRKNILNRLEYRLNTGMIEEVESLVKNGLSHDMLSFYGLEYKFISQFLLGEFSFDILQEKLGIAICQYAKRQNTFFRKMEKDGIKIYWLDAQKNTTDLLEEIEAHCKSDTTNKP